MLKIPNQKENMKKTNMRKILNQKEDMNKDKYEENPELKKKPTTTTTTKQKT